MFPTSTACPVARLALAPHMPSVSPETAGMPCPPDKRMLFWVNKQCLNKQNAPTEFRRVAVPDNCQLILIESK